jgi:uncharacterized Zn-binding protein involved in type VI secretion
MGQPAARVTDATAHGIPLTGAGCPTVLIGAMPAWRSVTPGGAGGAAALAIVSALKAAKQVSDTAIQVAEAATVAAVTSGFPPAIASAKAAEEATKAASAAAMGASMMSAASALAALGGGPPDLHTCTVPLPIPPHGPGLVTAGSTSVFIGGYAAARMGDELIEALGPPNKIAMGATNVLIG